MNPMVYYCFNYTSEARERDLLAYHGESTIPTHNIFRGDKNS